MSLELAHRIKNVFAVMDGVIALSARAEPQTAAFAETLRKRLHALGRATAYVSPSEAGGQNLPAIPTLHGLLRTLLEP
jgi:two-component sensor histidine kinase